MKRDWTTKLMGWLNLGNRSTKARRKSHRRSGLADRHGCAISSLEVLESRRLLTNVIQVTVTDTAVSLVDHSDRFSGTGDSFDITYTGTQMTLTGTNGTMFQVNGETVATYTATISGPVSLSMNLHSQGNTVTVTGDGTASLSKVNVFFGGGRGDNSLTMTKLIADSLTIHGGRRNDSVSLSQSTIANDFSADLGFRDGDSLELDQTTINGNMRDAVNQLVISGSTISGKFNSLQLDRNSSFKSTASTYNGAVTIRMGGDSVIGMYGSPDGPNHFNSTETVIGPRRRQPTIYEATNSVVNAVTPNLRNVNVTNLSATFTAPTVTALSAATTTPTVTGTYDSVNSPVLTVNVNGKTYQLGTDSELTSPSTGKWSLDLTGNPLTTKTATVTATAYDINGNSRSGTGTVTNEQFIINSYLTANNLTATKTASGLNYVITTNGSGALPTSGQTVTAKYTGYLLTSDGTQGTQFDSNTTGFAFTLGNGSVIAGWDEAFKLLPVGTTAKLLIPSSLAYKTTGSGSSIPPNSILIFDVTVVSAV